MPINILEETRKIDIIRVAEDLGLEVQQLRKISCIYHQEKTASLVFYPQNNSYHCFGCGKRGDVIHFYAGATGLDYKTAMHELAFHYVAGYEKRNFEPVVKRVATRPQTTADKIPDTKIYTYQPIHTIIYEDLQRFCGQLPDNDVSDSAWAYLKRRKFEDFTLRKFQIFVIKDYHKVNYYLRSQYTILDLKECGLYNDRDNLIFFRHPIIIPYLRAGRIVYLQGRVIDTPVENEARYQFLNGVPTELFNADVLEKLKINQMVYLTEGAFDCMMLAQQGLPSVSLGSANTFKHEWARLFKRFEVSFYFDNDKAGFKAAEDLEVVFTQAGVPSYRKFVKDGYKDINDYFMKRFDEGQNQ